MKFPLLVTGTFVPKIVGMFLDKTRKLDLN